MPRPPSPATTRIGWWRSARQRRPRATHDRRPPRTSRRRPASRSRATTRPPGRAAQDQRRLRATRRIAYSAEPHVAALAIGPRAGIGRGEQAEPERHRGDHQRQHRDRCAAGAGTSAASDATRPTTTNPFTARIRRTRRSPGRPPRPDAHHLGRTPAGTGRSSCPSSRGVSGAMALGSLSWQLADLPACAVEARSTDDPRGDEPDVRVAVGVRGAGVADAAGAPDGGEVEVVVGRGARR